MRIDLGSWSFNTNVADANGNLFFITDWEGWDSPALRQDVAPVAGRHGGVLGESLLGTRSVVLTGVCKAPSEAAFWAAYNGLLGLTNNLVSTIDLKVYEGTTTKVLRVLRGGSPRIRFQGVNTFTFELPLIAPNPLKFSNVEKSQVIASGASQTLNNAGNFETYPRVVTSAYGFPGLINNTLGASASFQVDGPLQSGTTIDFDRRTVLLGTNDQYLRVRPSTIWWTLQPGNNSVQNNGTIGVTVYWRDAWL